MVEQGFCGCINRIGEFEDIRHHLDEYAKRLEVLGWTETIAPGIYLKDFDLKSTFIVVSFAMEIDADHVIIALLGSGDGHHPTLSSWWC